MIGNANLDGAGLNSLTSNFPAGRPWPANSLQNPWARAGAIGLGSIGVYKALSNFYQVQNKPINK